jgi:hypothetical protein
LNGDKGAVPNRRIFAATIAIVCALALLAIGAASASAAPGRSVEGIFGVPAESQPRQIAVDSSGDIYVLLQEGPTRLEKFDPAGNPVPFSGSATYLDENELLGTFNGPFQYQAFTPTGLAIDTSGGPDDGNIYIALFNGVNSSVFIFNSAGIYQGRLGTTEPNVCGLAVGPNDGAVYVGNEKSGLVSRYAAPTGNSEAALPTGTLNAGLCQMAVDPAGNVYATNGSIVKYAASQFGVMSPVSTNLFENGGSIVGPIARDPGSGDLYASSYEGVYDVSSAGVQQGVPIAAGFPPSIAVRAGRLISIHDHEAIYTYGATQVDLPVVTGSSRGEATATTVELNGGVDPDGAGPITKCELRGGLTTAYIYSAPCSPGPPITSPTSVTGKLTGLTSNGVINWFTVVVTNANGTTVGETNAYFLGQVNEGLAGEATEVTRDSAGLGGSFVGNGEDAHAYFEWGRSTSYHHKTAEVDIGSGTGPQVVPPIPLSGLLGGTSYHYRLVTVTPAGSTQSGDLSFTTAPAVINLTTDPPTGVIPEAAELNASFEADSHETHYFFEWGSSTRYGQTAPIPPGDVVPAGSGRVKVTPVPIKGLAPGSSYHYRVVATNALGVTLGADQTFKTAEAPIILNPGTRGASAEGVELNAEINPRYGHTTYHFEYGPTTSYGSSAPVPDGDIGSGSEALPVAARLTGLMVGVTYHFRVVATNQYGTTYSADQTFGFYPPACPNAQLRQETQSNGLPDCRAYELVTPEFAQGAVIMPLGGPVAGNATNPAKLAYSAAFGIFPEETGDPINLASDMYVSTRTDNGWFQKYIGLPADEAIFMGGPLTNQNFGYFQGKAPNRIQVGTQASPDMSRVIDYNDGYPSGNFGQVGDWSNAPYVWNTSSGEFLGRWPSNLAQVPGGNKFIGVPEASADFSHLVFSSNVVFAPGGQATERELEGESSPHKADSIYDNNLLTSQVSLASRKADGLPFQGHVLNISEDGSRILMSEGLNPEPTKTDPGDLTGPLYLRVEGARTYEIAPGKKIHYIGSTADGKTVYLTSGEQLTPDDHDQSRDLYVWHESDPTALTRVSVGDTGGEGNSDRCQPNEEWTRNCSVEVINFKAYSQNFNPGQGGNGYSDNFIASKSGDIYFESPEQLVGSKGEVGQVNLYLYREGTVRFVTVVDPKPLCSVVGIGEVQEGCSAGPIARMQVTPDGAHMALVTGNNLTGYDSAGRAEMYVYDANSGRVSCASCRPDGKPPIGEVLASQNGLFQTNDGRVFFGTTDALVPRDTDEVEDIYEYTEGKAQLITAGLGTTITQYSGFVGIQTVPGLVSVSANGTDVYFATLDTLVSQDHNGASVKIYDARSGGGFPAERVAPKCAAADECHGATSAAPSPPVDRTSAPLGETHKKKKPKKHHKKKHHKHKKHAKKHKKKGKGSKGKAKKKAPGKKGKGGRNHG